jgi:hypothetical protein
LLKSLDRRIDYLCAALEYPFLPIAIFGTVHLKVSRGDSSARLRFNQTVRMHAVILEQNG